MLKKASFLHEAELQRGRNGNAREMAVMNRYLRLGYKPVALGDEEVRRKFKIVGPCADFVFERRAGHYLVGDSKGTGVGSAISQLRNTVMYLRPKCRHIYPQVVLIKPASLSETVVVGEGCTAVKDRSSGAYGLVDGGGRPVCLGGGEQIEVVFGS